MFCWRVTSLTTKTTQSSSPHNIETTLLPSDLLPLAVLQLLVHADHLVVDDGLLHQPAAPGLEHSEFWPRQLCHQPTLPPSSVNRIFWSHKSAFNTHCQIKWRMATCRPAMLLLRISCCWEEWTELHGSAMRVCLVTIFCPVDVVFAFINQSSVKSLRKWKDGDRTLYDVFPSYILCGTQH